MRKRKVAKKKPAPSWRKQQRADRATIKALRKVLVETQSKLARYEAVERQQRREEEMNWSLYDRCVDATTCAERELFEASPAYKKYQQHREAQAELYPYSQAEKRRRMLQAGNWRAP